jgi:hypothetical protein
MCYLGITCVHQPYSRDLTLNFFVLWVIEANVFKNPEDGGTVFNEIFYLP